MQVNSVHFTHSSSLQEPCSFRSKLKLNNRPLLSILVSFTWEGLFIGLASSTTTSFHTLRPYGKQAGLRGFHFPMSKARREGNYPNIWRRSEAGRDGPQNEMSTFFPFRRVLLVAQILSRNFLVCVLKNVCNCLSFYSFCRRRWFTNIFYSFEKIITFNWKFHLHGWWVRHPGHTSGESNFAGEINICMGRDVSKRGYSKAYAPTRN